MKKNSTKKYIKLNDFKDLEKIIIKNDNEKESKQKEKNENKK